MSIPKLIHQIWVGFSVPDSFKSNIVSWQRLNPEWNHALWTEENRPELHNEVLYRDAERYVPAHAVGQFRADILRYELLYQYGGFYADVDTYPLRPLGDLLDGLTEWAVREDSRWIANTYLAAEPEHAIFQELIEFLPDQAAFVKLPAAASVVSGPQYLTPIWQDMGGHVDERTELFFPYSWRDVKQGKEHMQTIHPEAYAIHEWAHQKGLKK